jgi:molybdenum cofactor cytidylyltransferase
MSAQAALRSERGAQGDEPSSSPRPDGASASTLAAAGVVLAAGRSARMGAERNKLVEAIAGRPLVAWPVDAMLEAGVDPVLVVTGFEAERVRAALAGRPCRFVQHEGWSEGMGSSLACAATEMLGWESRHEAILLCVGDLPGIRAAHVAAVVGAARDEKGRIDPKRIVVSTFEGRRGHPVLFGSGWLAALAQLAGDEGARQLVRANAAQVVEVEQRDNACLRDVDSPADLDAARAGPTEKTGSR